MPYKDHAVRLQKDKERRAKLRAENPEWREKQKVKAAEYHRRKQAEDEAYKAKRKADFAKWYAEHGKENARQRKGYKPAEEYLADCEAKREAKAAYMREWAQTEKGMRSRVAKSIKKRCGMTIEEYDEAYEKQNGSCLICSVQRPKYTADRLAVDHCHSTGKFRALLCHNCNTAIGLLGESEERMKNAITYLQTVCAAVDSGDLLCQ